MMLIIDYGCLILSPNTDLVKHIVNQSKSPKPSDPMLYLKMLKLFIFSLHSTDGTEIHFYE